MFHKDHLLVVSAFWVGLQFSGRITRFRIGMITSPTKGQTSPGSPVKAGCGKTHQRCVFFSPLKAREKILGPPSRGKDVHLMG